MKKPNVLIVGDEIHAGIDLEDANEFGPIKFGMVIQFESMEQLKEAIRTDRVEFDFMRHD